MRAVIIGLISACGASACEGRCGDFTFTLPETDAFYDGAGTPELKHPKQAFERCGRDNGSQGNWNAEGLISFDPGGDRVGQFSDLLLTVSFSTAGLEDGATLTARSQLGGVAFTGLALTHRDEATLAEGSTLTFHRIGPLLEEEVFNRRVLDVEWNLTWANGNGAKYVAVGRDALDVFVDK